MAIRKKKTKLNHLLEYSDKVVVLSQKYIQDCLSLTSTRNAHKLYAIPNLLTFQIPESLSSGTKQNILLYVGRLSYADKRVDRLLSVWKKLQPVHTDWSLYIVGDGEYRENLEKISEEYHLKRIFSWDIRTPNLFTKNQKSYVSPPHMKECLWWLMKRWPTDAFLWFLTVSMLQRK